MKKQKKGRRKCLLSNLLSGLGWLLVVAIVVIFSRSMLEILLLGETDPIWAYWIIALFFGTTGTFLASAWAQAVSYDKHNRNKK